MSVLTDMLTRHEGFRSKPYRDTVGVLTIGIGRNLDENGISQDEAIYMLGNDLAYYQGELRRTYPWFNKMLWPRQDALTDMAFNLGMARFRKFEHMLAALEACDYTKAAEEMVASQWAKQVGGRALELAAIMRTGEYQHEDA